MQSKVLGWMTQAPPAEPHGSGPWSISGIRLLTCRRRGSDTMITWVHQTPRLTWWLKQYRICLQFRRPKFDSLGWKDTWRRKWQPIPVFLPGESHGRRSLAGSSLSGRKGSDMTEHVTQPRAWIWGKNSFVVQLVKNLPAVQETWVWFLGSEDPPEEGMATHSSILAWRIPWTEKPGRLQSMLLQKVVYDWVTFTCTLDQA